MFKEIFSISELALTDIEWIGFAIVFSYITNRILVSISQKYLRHQKWAPIDIDIKSHFKDSLFWFLFIASLKLILPLLSLSPDLSKKANEPLSIALICFLAWLLTKFTSFIKIIVYSRFEIRNPNNLRERKIRTQVQFIEKIILIFIYTLSASFILMNFEGAKELGGSLIASAGLAGITLGFAAQKSLSNLLAGFQIAFTQPIRIDDVVVVEGEWGRIEEITLTYVVIRIWDKRTLIVPITYFLEKPFQNWTRASSDIIGSVFLHFDYTVTLNDLRKEFVKYLERCQLWDRKLQAVQVTNATETSIEVRFLMSARNASEAFDLRCLVREHMINYVREMYPNCFPIHRIKNNDLLPFQSIQGLQNSQAFE